MLPERSWWSTGSSDPLGAMPQAASAGARPERIFDNVMDPERAAAPGNSRSPGDVHDDTDSDH